MSWAATLIKIMFESLCSHWNNAIAYKQLCKWYFHIVNFSLLNCFFLVCFIKSFVTFSFLSSCYYLVGICEFIISTNSVKFAWFDHSSPHQWLNFFFLCATSMDLLSLLIISLAPFVNSTNSSDTRLGETCTNPDLSCTCSITPDHSPH